MHFLQFVNYFRLTRYPNNNLKDNLGDESRRCLPLPRLFTIPIRWNYHCCFPSRKLPFRAYFYGALKSTPCRIYNHTAEQIKSLGLPSSCVYTHSRVMQSQSLHWSQLLMLWESIFRGGTHACLLCVPVYSGGRFEVSR